MFTLHNLQTLGQGDLGRVVENQLQQYSLRGGVYRVMVASVPGSGLRQLIPRMLAVDRTGTVYIGHSRNLVRRLVQLVGSLKQPYQRAHHLGRLVQSHPTVSEQIAIEQWIIGVEPAPTPRVAEREALKRYFIEFGETPPWNVRAR